MDQGFRLRIYLLTALVLTGFGALASRLYEFQIQRQDEFNRKVPSNTVVTVREPGVRGEITDRNGIPLVRNLRSYELSFNLEEIHKSYTGRNTEVPKTKKVGKVDDMYRQTEEKDIVKIVNTWTIEPLRRLGLAKNYNANALRTHYITHKGLIPFSYRTDISYAEFAQCAEKNLAIPGIYFGIRPQRQYPYDALASHVLGYITPWRPDDIPDSAKRQFDHYVGDPQGVSGVEKTMDHLLRGQPGTTTLLKDDKGRVIRMIDRVKPAAGATVALSLDARLQLHVENVIRRSGRAAAVIMDVDTGEVIAMASIPDYNPNDFIPSIDATRWKEYRSNKFNPLGNRCISMFTPGSTFKPATAIAGSIEGMASRPFSCDGYIAFGKIQIGCWLWNQSKGRHGSLTLPKAIQQSCNPFFMKLANSIGNQAMVTGMAMVGLGKPTGIELPDESPGILPGSRQWRLAGADKVMTPSLNAMLAIGQGDAMASPLQLCAMTACIANGGKYYRPRIVKSAIDANGGTVVGDTPKLVVDLIKSGVKPADLEALRKGMWMAVNQPGGTAGRVKLTDVEVAAKTGTAQTSDDGKKSNNSWLIAFAPFEKPKYAVCVMVQNGGSGGKVCGPLANLILRGVFARDEGIKLPLRPQTAFVGNNKRIEEILLPKEDPLAAAVAAAGADEAGETGEEIADPDAVPLAPEVPAPVIPTPVITPETDAEGTVIPRAEPVTEP